MDLFKYQAARSRRGQPLAERMRPKNLAEFQGQQHLMAPGKLVERIIRQDQLPSIILWGPPGSGKTTLARLIAKQTGAHFFPLSAVEAGVKELRAIIEDATNQRDLYSKRSILFIDEIHRFNKAQQDALLPHVEAGTVVLIGATTENPSFEVIAPLLSRCRVLRLEGLSNADVINILKRAMVEDDELKKYDVKADDTVLELIAEAANGDARRALNTIEVAISLSEKGSQLQPEMVEQALQKRLLLYDKKGEEHYNVISAFIKSMRGSDPDAAIYWMARMLEAGEDPLFIIRRMVIFAAEDIGNADPVALQLAIAAMEAVRFVGLPEAVLPMAQAVTYLATAPKSNSALLAYSRARKDVQKHGPLPVPLHLRNAPTRLMKELGYGRDYQYPHDFEENYVPEHYLPEPLQNQHYYTPSRSGFEKSIKERLEQWLARKQQREQQKELEDVNNQQYKNRPKC